MRKKWKPCGLVGPANNEEPGINWVRYGVAALGEPCFVERLEYYGTESARDEFLLSGQSPRFAQ